MVHKSTMVRMTDNLIDFTAGAPVSGTLDVRWIHGSPSKRRNKDPKIQVHAHDAHTFILRQNKAANYEAPFLFLLFGNERALLLDTGAGADPEQFPVRETVDRLLTEWLGRHPRPNYELVVAHTHGHGDHVAGDGQFADRPATRLVPRELEAVQDFFGFDPDAWPAQTVQFDLGGRVLDLIGSPGHHKAAVTVYDPWTGILLTGDTVYPGRLYAFDFPEFTATLDRLTEYADSHPVTHVLGCHIEMSRRAGRTYPLGATYQPHEPPPQMTVAQLIEIRDAARSVIDQPGVHRYDEFVIFNGPCTKAMTRLVARGLVYRFQLSLLALNPLARAGR
jgi:hydroxyacylglutathione hydrolase